MRAEPAGAERGARVEGAAARLVVHPSVRGAIDGSLIVQARRLSEELPEPGSLEPGTWVLVSPGRTVAAGFIKRLFSVAPRSVHLAVRCTALVMRGYADVHADPEGMALGRAPGE